MSNGPIFFKLNGNILELFQSAAIDTVKLTVQALMPEKIQQSLLCNSSDLVHVAHFVRPHVLLSKPDLKRFACREQRKIREKKEIRKRVQNGEKREKKRKDHKREKTERKKVEQKVNEREMRENGKKGGKREKEKKRKKIKKKEIKKEKRKKKRDEKREKKTKKERIVGIDVQQNTWKKMMWRSIDTVKT